jgi:hypothetical protein
MTFQGKGSAPALTRANAMATACFTREHAGAFTASLGHSTNYFIIWNRFYKIITMPDELSIPVTTRVAAFGHSLAGMRARAAEAVFRLVLICTLLGYRMVRPDGTAVPEDHAVMLRGYRCPSMGIRGIFPADAGNAGSPRAFLPE